MVEVEKQQRRSWLGQVGIDTYSVSHSCTLI